MTIELVRGVTAIEQFQLTPGNHSSRAEGLCAMEAVAWLAGLPHSDRPKCTSEILAGYVRHLNDNMPDGERPRLIAYLPSLIGTADRDLDHVLNHYFAWQAVHLFAPAALRASGYDEHAQYLEQQRKLYQAQEAVKEISEEIWPLSQRECRPVDWALMRAKRSASLAPWFYSERNKFLKGVWGDTDYDACATTAAATALYAHNAGCKEAWDLALLALEEALTVASATPAT